MDNTTRQVRLVSMCLTNFKGARLETIDFNGRDTEIRGDNATGKTTVFDAFSWLLWGKDSLGQANFAIKTAGTTGVDHSVSAVMDVDGRATTLTRTYKEVYTKKRGSADAEFSGHTTDYAIDGVPMQKQEFDGRVAEIVPPAAKNWLTDPMAFCSSGAWQDRRTILFEMSGGVSDEQVCDLEPSLDGFMDKLGNRTLDEYKRVVSARKKEANEKLSQIPVRIDEATRASAFEPRAGLPSRSEAESEVSLAMERLSEARSGGDAARLTQELSRAEAAKLDRANELRSVPVDNTARQAALNELAGLRARLTDVRHSAVSSAGLAGEAELRHERLSVEAERLRQEWASVNAQAFEGPSSCPSCGQSLPEESVQAAVEAHNLRKSERLAAITNDGKRVASEAASAKADADEHRSAEVAADAEAKAIEEQIQSVVVPESSQQPRLEEDAEYRRLCGVADDARSKLAQATTDAQERLVPLQNAVTEAKAVLDAVITNEGRAKSALDAKARVDELKSEQKVLAAAYESAESDMFEIETFVRAKAKLVTESVNRLFTVTRWKLFEEQVNGGLAECCEATVDGVGWPDLNHASRVNCGLDVVGALTRHFGVALPVFVDHSESVTQKLPTPGQQVWLTVDEGKSNLWVSEVKPRQFTPTPTTTATTTTTPTTKD